MLGTNDPTVGASFGRASGGGQEEVPRLRLTHQDPLRRRWAGGDAAPAALQAGGRGSRPHARAYLRAGRDHDRRHGGQRPRRARGHGVPLPLQDRAGGRRATCWSTWARRTAPSSTACACARPTSSPAARCTLGQAELKFYAADEKVEIVPSEKDHLGDMIGQHVKLREIYAHRREDRPDRDHRRHRGRDRHRQGDRRARRSTSCRPRADGPFMVFDCGAVPPRPDRERAVRSREGLRSRARS